MRPAEGQSLKRIGPESAGAAAITVAPKVFNFRYRSPAHFIDVFRTWYGPVHKAYAALGEEQGAALTADLTELMNRLNRGGADRLLIGSDYAEIVVTRA